MGSIIAQMRYYSYEDIDIFLTQCPVCSIVNDCCTDLLPPQKSNFQVSFTTVCLKVWTERFSEDSRNSPTTNTFCLHGSLVTNLVIFSIWESKSVIQRLKSIHRDRDHRNWKLARCRIWPSLIFKSECFFFYILKLLKL